MTGPVTFIAHRPSEELLWNVKKMEVFSVGQGRAELTENTVSLHNLHMENARRNNKEGHFFKMVFGGTIVHN